MPAKKGIKRNMGPPISLFSNIIHNTINDKQIFGSYSLLNDLQNLIKIFPRNFEISTNNGKYKFNKNLVEIIIPNIREAISKNEDLNKYHFDINDERNVMQKIENLFKGEPVEFINSEENTLKKIISFFKKGSFPIQMSSFKLREKITMQMDLRGLIDILQYSPRNFEIRTNQECYKCNSLGIMSSKTILAYLQSHPTSTEFFYDYNEQNDELMKIIDFFNWNTISINLKEAYSILPISKQLGITSLIDPLKSFITEMDKKAENTEEYQKIIDPYDELFENLFNINKIGIEKVADFIEKSEWVSKNDDVKELAACIINTVKLNLSVSRSLADLVQLLSSQKGPLSELAPFLIDYLLNNFTSNNNLCAFLYHLSQINLVSVDDVISKIKEINMPNHNSDYEHKPQFIYWFLPEIYDQKIFRKNKLIQYLNFIQIQYHNHNNNNNDDDDDDENLIEESIAKIRILRDKSSQLIESIQKDDIGTFQSIVTNNSIDIDKTQIKLTVFDDFNDEITFIDYSSYCGSLKCFKYLFLQGVTIKRMTFDYAIIGGNAEIIRILDQNKDKFEDPKFMLGMRKPNYFLRNNLTDPITTAIAYHRNDIFDWLFENTDYLDPYQPLNNFFVAAACNLNVHAISKIIETGFNVYGAGYSNLFKIISCACSNGFYRLLIYMSKLIKLSDYINPSIPELKHNIQNEQENILTKTINDAVSFGNIKILNLLFENMKVKYSVIINNVILNTAKLGKIEAIKFLLENKIYELSDFSLVQVIGNSIEYGRDELTNYLFNKIKDFPLTAQMLSKACTAKDIKILKILIQKANEKGIPIDYTIPFIDAALSDSEEIIKLFIELKVGINFEKVFKHFNTIAETAPKIILLLINETKTEFKNLIIQMSFKSALLTNNIEILKFLLNEKYEFEGLLIEAAKHSNLEIIKIILEFNHSAEFINQIGKFGTALFEAVRRTNKWPKTKSENKIIEYLLKQEGIDPSISVDSINTPLIVAIKINNDVAVGLILDFYGDNIKYQGKQVHEAFQTILKKQSERIEKNKNNKRIFYNNNNNNDKEKIIFSMLLKIKNLPNVNMQEELMSYAILENDVELVKNLLNNDLIDINKKITNGDTYFHLSIEGKSVTPIQTLLLNNPNVDINVQNVLKETPLVKAVKTENKELVEMILNHPKFDASLSLIDYAFLFSVKFKDILKSLIKIDSLDVNYNQVLIESKRDYNNKIITPLIEAVKTGDLEIIKIIIDHKSFDPIRSQLISCLFMAIKEKNLKLFKFFLELNSGDINIKNLNNQSLLCFAASVGNNYEILNEILGNQKFDPVKSDIQKSFINSADIESRIIILEYDKGCLLSFDKIYLLFKLYEDEHHHNTPIIESFQASCEFFLRKMNLLPMIPSICTSLLSKNHKLYQQYYNCLTCGKSSLCEICAKVCHKGHQIVVVEYNSYCKCNCDENCKCRSITQSIHDELYDSFFITRNGQTAFNEDDDDDEHNEYMMNEPVNEEEEEEEEREEINCLRCTLDLSGFNSMSQPMYRCRKCKANICQSCAIRCHKNHPLNFRGFECNTSCQCFKLTDCKCTSCKDVVCTYAFYGNDYIYQPWFRCFDCEISSRTGCCASCVKKCHKGHNTYREDDIDAYCDCGANDLSIMCCALDFPPFNYLSSCTNREQKYQIMKQRMFQCKTCGITAQNQGICEACALLCHLGHKVVYIGIREFVCECFTMNPCCTAPSCPEISCDGVCNRLKQGKDKLFPAFVCLSCDKEGEKRFCKSCALICHKGHDVHFIEYSNFNCKCNPCQCTKNKCDQ